jgi:predicted nucleic acid-binding protein
MTEQFKTRLLLDTNIVTYVSSHTDWERVYEPILFGKRLYIGFMTFAELLEAACHKNMSEKNIQKYANAIRKRYSIIPWNEAICWHFASIRVQRRNRPISVPDALIAATALAYDLPLVTHNTNDFTEIDGLRIITRYDIKE